MRTKNAQGLEECGFHYEAGILYMKEKDGHQKARLCLEKAMEQRYERAFGALQRMDAKLWEKDLLRCAEIPNQKAIIALADFYQWSREKKDLSLDDKSRAWYEKGDLIHNL